MRGGQHKVWSSLVSLCCWWYDEVGLSREQQTHGAGAEGSGRGGGRHRNKGIGVEGVSGVLVWRVW